MRKPIIGGNALTLSDAYKLIQLASRVQSSGHAFLFLDGKTKRIYEGIVDKQFGGAYEIKRLDDSYFTTTSVEAFADMLWFELGWTVNVNSLKSNVALMQLFAKGKTRQGNAPKSLLHPLGSKRKGTKIVD